MEIYKELAEIYEKLNCFDTAAVYYSDFLKRGGKEVTLADYFHLGKCYYFAAADSIVTDTTIRKAHLVAVDSMFGYVAEKKPDSYLGNFWRARVNLALDPEIDKGLAQPYYEAAADLPEKDGNGRARLIVECYSYLGYYYYLKSNTTVPKEYWNKILALAPTN